MSPLPPLVVMGVSGSGKSTVGAAIATALGLPFADADALHPEASRLKMAAGIPLDDEDRAPWLEAVGSLLARGPMVVACSALRRRYRDQLRAVAPDLELVYLRATPALLAERLAGRTHEFMPATLLDSQLATLEEPGAEEHPIVVDAQQPVEDIVATVADRMGAA